MTTRNLSETISEKPLRRLATLRSSNVDKVMEPGEQIVRLCNYVDVYYNDRITGELDFSQGSATPQEIKRFGLKNGDVVITKDSETPEDIAVPALVLPSAEGVVCGYHLAILRPIETEVFGPYLFWSLKAKPVRDAFSIRAQGVTRYGLTLGSIASVAVPVPNIEIQKAIAIFLDRETSRIDQLIEKKTRQVIVLAAKKSATIHDLVRNGSRAHCALKATGDQWFPAVPQHWEPIRIRYLFRGTKRQGMPELDVLSVYRDYGVILKSSRDDNINRTPEDLTSYQFVDSGDLVINKMKAWQGSLGIATLSGITSPDYLVYRPIRPMCSRFMHYYFRAQPMPSLFLSISNGIRTDQWRLEHEKFIDIRAWLPPLAEQEEIAAAIDSRTFQVEKSIDLLQKSIDLLKERRAALITAAVMGQIDVRPNAVAAKPRSDCTRFRLIVGAEIIHQHKGNPKFGRVKLQKELYLAEAHVGISELQGNYLREAAGPLDRALIDDTEKTLESEGFYRKRQPDGAGTVVTYAPLSKAGQHTAELSALLGPRADTLRDLINLLRDLDRREVEAVTTLFAVWNDILIDGRKPDDNSILKGVLTDWHREKGEKFRQEDLKRWLGWMKRHGLTPRGQGPRTAHTMTRDMFS